MKLFNFIVWLSTGAVIGWFAQWMVKTEHRQTQKPVPGKDRSSKKV
jgi:hypothetical protein